MSKEKVTLMMDQLSIAYADEQVAAISELQELLFNAAQELEKNEDTGLVAANLTGKIAIYSLGHNNQVPKAVSTLYYQIKRDAEKYKGIAITAMMVPVWGIL